MRPVTITHPGSTTAAIDLLANALRSLLGPTQDRIFSRDHIEKLFGAGRRRPEWVWQAVDTDGQACGVIAGFTPFPDADHPAIVDIHAAPDSGIASRLYAAALNEARTWTMPEPLVLLIQVDASADVLSVPAVAAAVGAAEQAGFTVLVVRRRFEMEAASPGRPIPSTLTLWTPTDADDPRLHDVLVRTLEGTLDAHDRHSLTTASPDEVATRNLEILLDADPLDGFGLAYDDREELVGIVVGAPWGNATGAVSFVAVLPEHRGKGYAAQLVSAKTRELIRAGVDIIVGDTDEANSPMANAFVAAGFHQTESRVDLVPVD